MSHRIIRTRGRKTKISLGDTVETYRDTARRQRIRGKVKEMEGQKVTKVKTQEEEKEVITDLPCWKIKREQKLKYGEKIMPEDADRIRQKEIMQVKERVNGYIDNYQDTYYIITETDKKDFLFGIKYFVNGKHRETEVYYEKELKPIIIDIYEEIGENWNNAEDIEIEDERASSIYMSRKI